jgi:hypothetical protein
MVFKRSSSLKFSQNLTKKSTFVILSNYFLQIFWKENAWKFPSSKSQTGFTIVNRFRCKRVYLFGIPTLKLGGCKVSSVYTRAFFFFFFIVFFKDKVFLQTRLEEFLSIWSIKVTRVPFF